MKNICIIPARGGSKRIPKKNIKEFCGKPIIKYAIDIAVKSKLFDHVIVSTDDEEIAQTAKNSGAEIPFIRPKNISGDYVGTLPVIRHTIDFYIKQGFKLNFVACLYATAPFILKKDLVNSINNLKDKYPEKIIFSATNYSHPIQRALTLTTENFSKAINPESVNNRTQDLTESFHDAAQFYIGNVNSWMKTDNILIGNVPYFLPSWRVNDIDNLDDWIRAELLFESLKDKKLM